MPLQAIRGGAVTTAPRDDLDGNPASGELTDYEVGIGRISQIPQGVGTSNDFRGDVSLLVSNKESKSWTEPTRAFTYQLPFSLR